MDCFRNKTLKKTTCRFIKNCKNGRTFNKSYKCVKSKKQIDIDKEKIEEINNFCLKF
jgi:hypothetical protein